MNNLLMQISISDIADICSVAILIYFSIRFIYGTRAMSALNGLFLILFIYLTARFFNLYTLEWLLENVISSLFIVIVILFHEDIRHALSTLNFRALFKRKQSSNANLIDVLVSACFLLAEKKIGAIIVLERNVSLGDMLKKGVILDAKPTVDLLMTIFFPNTALHDGAVIISRDQRIQAAGCVLPLANLARQHFGTRHRAGIGVTEVSDCISLIVSEERGQVTFAQNGKLSSPLNRNSLEGILNNVFENK